MNTLSDRQYAILQFIHQHITDHGFVPSIREIGREVKISSMSAVNYNLHRLTAQGYLVRTPWKARAFALTGRAHKLFEEQYVTNLRELREEIRLLRQENEQLRHDHKSRIATLRREYERALQEMKEPQDTAAFYPA